MPRLAGMLRVGATWLVLHLVCMPNPGQKCSNSHLSATVAAAWTQAGTLELGKGHVTVALMSLQNIMFYDMGAGSTVCTIVTYQTVKTKEAGIQPQLQIRGVG